MQGPGARSAGERPGLLRTIQRVPNTPAGDQKSQRRVQEIVCHVTGRHFSGSPRHLDTHDHTDGDCSALHACLNPAPASSMQAARHALPLCDMISIPWNWRWLQAAKDLEAAREVVVRLHLMGSATRGCYNT